MNPFLKDPIAQPLAALSVGSWRTPVRRHAVANLSRRAGAAMMAAGLTVALPAQALDVNVASVIQLETLRGIGPRTAKMIVHERSRAGAFASLEDLSDRVKGLGERRIRALSQAGLKVNDASTAASTAASMMSQHPMRVEERPEASRATKRLTQSMPKPVLAKPEIIAPPSF